ncbi:isomerizing glutamine--fructose-6-phosphate transaminase [Chitinilyticum aquatile]|uniref:isomerizing glutamine--fructose-6-phosphate transaminase n=1 Tax=Chitinilyticum aquatile TaxID=362520 RepID=UPI000407D9F5|nr:isomerizing glutamine--fructose-6-phosphate transaminase [Chitinilyticum aquatile]
MAEIIAYIAPQNVLPAFAESLQALHSSATHLALVASEQASLQVQHHMLDMPAAKPVFANASRWLIGNLSGTGQNEPFIHGNTLVVSTLGACSNHADLAQKACLPVGCSLASLIGTLLHAQLHRGATMSGAIQQIVPLLQGSLAFVCHHRNQPQYSFACSLGEPLHVGLESGLRQLCCSSARLIRERSTQYHTLKRGEIVRFGLDAPVLFLADGETRSLSMVASKSSGQAHHMLEEILDQSGTLATQQAEYLADRAIPLALKARLSDIRSVTLVASGSSYHAALVASYWFESLAGIRAYAEQASEYRDRDIRPDSKELLIAISQSGETADTLVAVQHATTTGSAHTVALTNSPGSSLTKLCDHTLQTHSGEELSVTSTKSFTAQLLLLFQLAITLARVQKKAGAEQLAAAEAELQALPAAVEETLQHNKEFRRWASLLHNKPNLFVLGRNTLYPVALEGAFKLQEVAYQHADGYAAGELKHGPVTLISEDLPIIVCLPWNERAEKTLLGLQEVRAGKGELFILSDGLLASSDKLHVIRMPNPLQLLNPVIYAIALQLIAYHCAVLRGNNIDAPRNLAKTQAIA